MSAFSRYRPSPWASMARPRCPDCGGIIGWMPARDLVWLIAPGDRLRAFELIDFVGQDADSWSCSACGSWGIFDGTHAL